MSITFRIGKDKQGKNICYRYTNSLNKILGSWKALVKRLFDTKVFTTIKLIQNICRVLTWFKKYWQGINRVQKIMTGY